MIALAANLLVVYMISQKFPEVNGQEQKNISKGTQCGNTNDIVNNSETGQFNADEYRCVECFFPQNCLEGGHCRLGTTGSTCEKCIRSLNESYFRVGNTCVKCPQIPWPSVSFGVFLLIVTITFYRHGFTNSLCTKIKLLCHFLQLLLLTFHVKIAWSDELLEKFSFVNFAMFTSYIVIPECMFPSMPTMMVHYIEWFVALLLPTFLLIIGNFIDNRVELKKLEPISEDGSEVRKMPAQRKTVVRRFMVLVLLVSYAPVTLASLRTYLCSDTVSKDVVLDHSEDVFLLDNDSTCTTLIFQMIHFLGFLMLLFVSLMLPPLTLFFTLRQRKWDLLYSHWILYSPIYESYDDKHCYWEVLVMLRKLVSVVVTEVYPFPVLWQVAVQLGTSVLYFVLLTGLKPFRPVSWKVASIDVHAVFEILSTMVLICVQGLGLSMVLEIQVQYLDNVAMISTGFVLGLWVLFMITVGCETQQEWTHEQIEASLVPLEDESVTMTKRKKRKARFLKNNKVEDDPKYIEMVNKNKEHISF